MKNTLNHSVGMATILLLAGIGISSCSSPATNSNPSEAPISQTKASEVPVASETPAPEVTQEKVVHTQSEVSNVVDSFFFTLDKESRAGMETIANATEENQTAVIKAVYPETLAYFSKDLDEKTIEQMIVVFSSFSMIPGNLTVTLPEEEVILLGDKATVPGDRLTLTLDGKVVPKAPTADETAGKLHLSYNEHGMWDISGFDLGSAAAAKATSKL